MITTIIFDLDDTLYNEKMYVFGAFNEVSDYLSKKYKLNSKYIYDDMIEFLNKHGRGKIFDMICDKYKLFNEDINNLVNIYRNAVPSLELYKDSIDILNWLKRKKYNIGLITDGNSKVQYNKIKALKINNFIEKIVVSDDLGKEYWKPHEKPYLEVINYFNVQCNECIYIGDNPRKDFVGARKLGLKTARIIREEGDHIKTFLSKEYEADFNIDDLLQIKEILLSLERDRNE